MSDDDEDAADDEHEDEDDLEYQVVVMPGRAIIPLADGGYFVALPAALRELVQQQLGELRTTLMSDAGHPDLQRLFPTAYNEDPELDEEYQRLMRSELLSSRLASFDSVEQTLEKEVLTEDELQQWMQAVNAVRLALATTIGLDSEEFRLKRNDPRFPTYEVYGFLSVLLGDMVEALRVGGAVDDAGR